MPRKLILSAFIFGSLSSFNLIYGDDKKEAAPVPAPVPVLAPVPVPAPTAPDDASVPAAPESKAPEQSSSSPSKPDDAAAPAQDGPKPVKPVACVSVLEDILLFHQKEIVSTQKMIGRWNARLQSYIDRQVQLDGEIESLGKELDEKKSEDAKRYKKEIARLGKQIERLKKDKAGIEKNLRNECGELASEINDAGKENSAALKERYQQAVKDIKSTN